MKNLEKKYLFLDRMKLNIDCDLNETFTIDTARNLEYWMLKRQEYWNKFSKFSHLSVMATHPQTSVALVVIKFNFLVPFLHYSSVINLFPWHFNMNVLTSLIKRRCRSAGLTMFEQTLLKIIVSHFGQVVIPFLRNLNY